MLDFLKGKKTYLVAATAFILAGLPAIGVTIPVWVYGMLASAGLMTTRAAIKKAE